MGFFTDCAVGKYCQQDNFVRDELNEEGVCDACVAVTSYIETQEQLQAEIQEQDQRASLEELRYNQREVK